MGNAEYMGMSKLLLLCKMFSFSALSLISFVGVAYCQSSPLAFGNNLSNSRPIALTSIKDAIPTTPVVVVSKSYCPYSRGAKRILNSYAIDESKIKIFEIENEPDMNEIQSYMAEITGGRTVPRIFIGGQFVGGAEELVSLHYSQRLDQILSS